MRLPRLQRQGERKTVVVLGGGLAGLAAAYELDRAGHRVSVLEARRSAGGRVRTLRNFADGQYAEAGALYIAAEHAVTLGYVEEFSLPLRAVRLGGASGLAFMAHLRGHHFRIDARGRAAVPFALTPAERTAGVFGLTHLYLGRDLRSAGLPHHRDWPPPRLRALDAMSLRRLLISRGASRRAIDIISATQLGIIGRGLGTVSALDALVMEAGATSRRLYEIVGGNDRLPAAFAQRLGRRLRTGAVVTHIAQDSRSVHVTYRGPVGPRVVTADHVVCALPFPVLAGVEVTPRLPADKQHAIRSLRLTPVTRTFQQFRRRVWEGEGLNGYAITDLPIQDVYSPTVTQPGRRGILVSYAGGRRALALGAMSERARHAVVLRGLGALFTGLDPEFETGTSIAWHADPFARGGFTYLKPGQLALLPVARRSEGRLHFAGEHVSGWRGWMNGALESGRRAAAVVNAAPPSAP